MPDDPPRRRSPADVPDPWWPDPWWPDPWWLVVHGDRPDDPSTAGPSSGLDLAPPIRPTTTFMSSPDPHAPRYRRTDDPTVARLERLLGALDGGAAVAYGSGMAAVSAVLRAFSPVRVLLPTEVYHGVREAAAAWADETGGRVEPVPPPPSAPPEGLREGDLLWVESPSNPRLLISDLVETMTAARRQGAFVVVDATIATPILLRALDAGVDAVLHATTKFINGHSDALGGVVATRDPGIAERLRSVRRHGGAVMGTFDAWLTLRGVRTLPLRIARQGETARSLAEALAGRVSADGPIRRVWHPSLPSHPTHGAAAALGGPVPLLSITFADDEVAARVEAGVRVFRPATSFGGVESTLEHRRRSDPDAPAGLVRVSPGLEPPDMLLDDLLQAIAGAPR